MLLMATLLCLIAVFLVGTAIRGAVGQEGSYAIHNSD